MYARLRSQVSAPSESGSPCENAKPALVVASAGNPSCCRYRAEPTSHGFGITKQPASCRARNAPRRALKFSTDSRPSIPTRCVVIRGPNSFIASSTRLTESDPTRQELDTGADHRLVTKADSLDHPAYSGAYAGSSS